MDKNLTFLLDNLWWNCLPYEFGLDHVIFVEGSPYIEFSRENLKLQNTKPNKISQLWRSDIVCFSVPVSMTILWC